MPKNTGVIRSGGINNSGAINTAGGDVIGRDKVVSIPSTATLDVLSVR